MIAFLCRPAGRWTVRVLAVPLVWAILALGLGIDWYASGDALLIGLFLFILGCGVYVVDQMAAMVADLAALRRPAAARMPQPLAEAPPLSKTRQATVRKLAGALADAGLFAPEVPDPALAFAQVADGLQHGSRSRTTLEDVLHALIDPREWHPAADPPRWNGNIVLHATQVEQMPEYLAEQVHDLARISHGALQVEQVTATIDGNHRTAPVTLRLILNGQPQEWHWQGHAKHLSTVIHARMAAALEAAATGERLAFFLLDQGFIFACLPEGALDRLAGLPSWGHGWVEPDFATEAGSINA